MRVWSLSFLSLFIIMGLLSKEGRATEVFTSNPLSTISQSGDNIILHKELYAAYNYPTRYSPTGTDILYDGDSATWTFDLNALGLDPSDYVSEISVVLSTVLDDCNSDPESSYTGLLTINGSVALDGAFGASHGTPCSGPFTNYTDLPFGGTLTSDVISISLLNNTVLDPGNRSWIAIDYIDVTLTVVPEPSTALLLGIGLAGLGMRRRQRTHRRGC